MIFSVAPHLYRIVLFVFFVYLFWCMIRSPHELHVCTNIQWQCSAPSTNFLSMGLSKEISQWWKYANPTPPTGSLFLQSSNKTRPGWQSSVTPHCLRSVSLRSQANLVYSSISGEHEYHYHYKRFYTWPLKRSQSAWLTQLLCVVILYSVFIQFDCQWLVQFNFHCLLLVKNWRWG